MFLTCSVPSCWLSLNSLSKNNSTAWCFKCSRIGCFALKSNWFLPILPLARISPSSSRKGDNCSIFLPFGICFSTFRGFISSPNYSRCSNLNAFAFSFFNADYKCFWFACDQCSLYVYHCIHWSPKVAESFLLNNSFDFFSLYHEDWWGYFIFIWCKY